MKTHSLHPLYESKSSSLLERDAAVMGYVDADYIAARITIMNRNRHDPTVEQ